MRLHISELRWAGRITQLVEALFKHRLEMRQPTQNLRFHHEFEIFTKAGAALLDAKKTVIYSIFEAPHLIHEAEEKLAVLGLLSSHFPKQAEGKIFDLFRQDRPR